MEGMQVMAAETQTIKRFSSLKTNMERANPINVYAMCPRVVPKHNRAPTPNCVHLEGTTRYVAIKPFRLQINKINSSGIILVLSAATVLRTQSSSESVDFDCIGWMVCG